MAVTLEVQTEDRISPLISQMLSRMKNLKEPMGIIGRIVEDSVLENFRTGRAPDGTPWKPSLRAIREGGLTLVDNAILRNSINNRPHPDRVEIGTSDIRAATHQLGARKGAFGTVSATVRAHVRNITRAFGRPISPRMVAVRSHTRQMVLPWGDIPARPFLGVKNEDWDDIRSSLVEYLARRRER